VDHRLKRRRRSVYLGVPVVAAILIARKGGDRYLTGTVFA